jgi:hypothetical protein
VRPGEEDGWLLKLTSTAVAALVFEFGALLFLTIHKAQKDEVSENKQ